MGKSLVELHLERQRLQERIASQRLALRVQLAPLQKASAVGGRAAALFASAVRYVKDRPLAALIAVFALVLLKPRGAMRWVQRGVIIWRGWRAVKAWSAWVPQALWAHLSGRFGVDTRR